MTVGFFVKHSDDDQFEYTHDARHVLVMMSGNLTEWEVAVTLEETDQTIASINGQEFFDRCVVRFE